MKHCLDSWAVLAWLDGEEPAAEIVQEVHYRTTREHGRQVADEVLAELRPRIDEDLPGISMMRTVSRLMAENPIALADCFAIALDLRG